MQMEVFEDKAAVARRAKKHQAGMTGDMARREGNRIRATNLQCQGVGRVPLLAVESYETQS